MKSRKHFFDDLKPGDIITTVGCVSKGREAKLVTNNWRHEKWGRYARVTEVEHDEVRAKTAVRYEGIDPNITDAVWHESSGSLPKMRKATPEEHRIFMEEYLKNRLEVNEHRSQELRKEIRRLNAERKDLQKLAEQENITECL